MKQNLPIPNNKLAFFDFDRTLVSHDYSDAYKMADNYFAECLYALTVLEDEHRNDRPLRCMQWYTKKLFDEDYGLYCLSHEIFNLRDMMKQRELKEFYHDTPMTYLTVNTPEHKIDMIKAVASIECCDLHDVIFVDDMISTVKQAIREGIDGRHLSDIVTMYEYTDTYEEQGTFIRPKGLDAFLHGGASSQTDEGISDDELEAAYQECRKVIDKDTLLMHGKDMTHGHK